MKIKKRCKLPTLAAVVLLIIFLFANCNVSMPPKVAYLEISPERVLQPTTTGLITLTLTDPANIDGVKIVFTTGDFTPLAKTAAYKWSVSIEAAKLLQNYKSGEPQVITGYLDTYFGTTRITRYNLIFPVLSSVMPVVAIQRLGPHMQISDHVLNIQHNELFLGESISWAIQQKVKNTIGKQDFYAFVGQVEAFANRYGGSVLAFPNANFFDLANKGVVHEIGHKWLAHSKHPLIKGDPHWGVGNAADGIMGWTSPADGEGLHFPYHIAPGSTSGTTQLWAVTDAVSFNELELYKMGILPKDQVSPILQFTDQDRIKAWLKNHYFVPSAGDDYRLLDIPSAYVTIDEIIATDDPTPSATQTNFTLGTTVLSADRLLTANEMAYFDYMAARGEGTVPVETWEGLSHYTSQPFYAATGGRMTIETQIRATTSGSMLCPAKQVLGADNPKLGNLRDFRDSKLAHSAIGREIIQIYYNNSDSINTALECSPALRSAAKKVLLVIAPMVGGINNHP